MAAKFAPGAAVKQVMPAPITGTVTSYQFDPNSGEIHYIVQDADGHGRSFTEDQIELA